MKTISIIVPCYNEENNLPLFYKEISKVIKELKKKVIFELIFINDGSKDNTLQVIKELSKKDDNIKYISFSRNFFKEAGLYAGLRASSGDYIAVMDADLQDPPSLLPEMLDYIEKDNYDVVATCRRTRKGESKLRTLGANTFYKLINKLSDANIKPGARDFRLMTRQVVESILNVSEYNRFSKGIFSWVGYDTKWIEYDNIERAYGKSNIKFTKLISYAIEGLVAFSTTPLVISSFIGILFLLISFIVIIVIIVKTIFWGDPVSGWPSLACIVFLVSGVQLFCTGIMGEYLAKTYLETKKRPIYIIKETNIDKLKSNNTSHTH